MVSQPDDVFILISVSHPSPRTVADDHYPMIASCAGTGSCTSRDCGEQAVSPTHASNETSMTVRRDGNLFT